MKTYSLISTFFFLVFSTTFLLAQVEIIQKKWNYKPLLEANEIAQNKGDLASYDQNIFYAGRHGLLHHLKKFGNEWKDEIIGESPHNKVTGSIATYKNHVFYKGLDETVHLYQFVDGNWIHQAIGQNKRVMGDIAASEGHVYFKGKNKRLNHLAYKPSSALKWEHEIIGGKKHQIEENIVCYHKNVYYHGTDNLIHRFYKKRSRSDIWNYQSFWRFAKNPNFKVKNDLVGFKGNMFYKGTDDQVYRLWFDHSGGGWTHERLGNTSNTYHKVHPQDHPERDNIAVYRKHVFYKGIDNRIQQFYHKHGSWKHASLLTSQNHKVNNSITTYEGNVVFKKTGDLNNPLSWFIWSAEFSNLKRQENVTERSHEEKLIIPNKKVSKNYFNVFPNPASSNLMFSYSIKNEANLKIDIFNSQGHRINVLIDNSFKKGEYQNQIDIKDYTPGIYFIRFMLNSQVKATQKVVII